MLRGIKNSECAHTLNTDHVDGRKPGFHPFQHHSYSTINLLAIQVIFTIEFIFIAHRSKERLTLAHHLEQAESLCFNDLQRFSFLDSPDASSNASEIPQASTYFSISSPLALLSTPSNSGAWVFQCQIYRCFIRHTGANFSDHPNRKDQ